MVIEKDNDAPRMACSYCGVFRRQGINHLAAKVGADVIALGHNLDDMAQTVLMNVANADLERTLRLAPHTATPVDGLLLRGSCRSVGFPSRRFTSMRSTNRYPCTTRSAPTLEVRCDGVIVK